MDIYVLRMEYGNIGLYLLVYSQKRILVCIHFYISWGHFSAERRRNMNKSFLPFVRFGNVKYVARCTYSQATRVRDVFALKAQVLRFHSVFSFFFLVCVCVCVSFADIFTFLHSENLLLFRHKGLRQCHTIFS